MCAARVRPSGLQLTVPCPGSLSLQEKVEATPKTREQAEGSVAHIVALKHAQGLGAEWQSGRTFEYNGTTWTIDDDMVDGAILYKGEAQIGGRFEEGIAIPDIPECEGTPDYWQIIQAPIPFLKLIDYKYGHRYVEVWEHWQTVGYATGVARFLNLPADFPVKLVIVQPRCYTAPTIREWPTTVGALYKLIADRVTPRVLDALNPFPPTYTGRHCLDCRARHACTTLQKETANIVEYASAAQVFTPPAEAVGQELRILKEAMKHLEARYTGLFEHAKSLVRSGVRVPYWTMKPTRGKYDWLPETPHEYVAQSADLLGVNVRKPLKLLTPTQAIDAGIDASIIDLYAKRYTGAAQLQEDDLTQLRKIFGDNSGT